MIDLLQGIGILLLAFAGLGQSYWHCRLLRDVQRLERRVRRLDEPCL
jgi:hypothetical protein